MSQAVNESLRDEMMVECLEHLDAAEAELLTLADGGSSIAASSAESLIRQLHAVQEAAACLENSALSELSTTVKGVMTRVRDGRRSLPPGMASALFESVDCLRQLLWDRANPPDIVPYQRRLLAVMSGQFVEAERQGVVAKRTIRSLVVEDEFTSRFILQDYLGTLGECHVAVNGMEAVELCRVALASGRLYDLICMDIRMPGMDGQKAVEEIRKLEEENGIRSSEGAKVVMTTAVSDVKSVFRAFRALCDAYVVKPVDIRLLRQHMKTLGLMA